MAHGTVKIEEAYVKFLLKCGIVDCKRGLTQWGGVPQDIDLGLGDRKEWRSGAEENTMSRQRNRQFGGEEQRAHLDLSC